MSSSPTNLLSRKLLARNSLFNLLGSVLPVLVALIAIPVLIREIGTERFGILSLVWMFVGYFSLFDLGLGRAVTKLVSEKTGAGQDDEIPPLIWTSALLMFVLSIAGVLLTFIGAEWLVSSVLKVSPELESETLLSFYGIGLSLPFIVNISLLRGILIAYQRFDLVNLIRIPMGIMNFLAPLAVLPFSNNLVYIVSVLIAMRVVAWVAYLICCYRRYQFMFQEIAVRYVLIRPLLNFGGWMTVTNIVSPLMTYLDRFFIASLVSTSAVAYYTAPYQVVTKLLIIPGALLGVLFPAFSSSLHLDVKRTGQLFENALQAIFIIVFPVVLFITVFAHEGLMAWLGMEFADNSSVVLQLLVLGTMINSLTMVPFTLIQSGGRPDLTAKFHLLELPVYIAALWVVLPRYGIAGAAAVWGGRIVLDGVLLSTAMSRLFPAYTVFSNKMIVLLFLFLSLMVPAMLLETVVSKIIFAGFVFVVISGIFYCVLLGDEEKMHLRRYLKKILQKR